MGKGGGEGGEADGNILGAVRMRRTVADPLALCHVHGLAVRVGRKSGALRAGLALSASLPASIDDELTSVELARHAAAVSVGYAPWEGPRAAVAAELALGVVGFFRSTVALQPEAVPTPNRVTAALLVSPGVRFLLRPAGSSRSGDAVTSR